MRLYIRFIGVIGFTACGFNAAAQEFSSETVTARPTRVFSFNGYLKALPSLDFTNLTDDVNFNNIFHNRLNFRYSHNNNLFCA
jgi:hypothetical protein